MQVGDSKTLEEKQLLSFSQQKELLSEQYNKLVLEKEKLNKDINVCSLSLREIKEKVDDANKTLADLEKTEARSSKSKEVEELVVVNDNLRAQEIKFREQCKHELAKLQHAIE